MSETKPTQDGQPTPEENEEPSCEVHEHEIGPRGATRRLDRFLQDRHPRISRTVLQRHIKEGQVTVNGLPSKASYVASPGDVIRITLPPPPPREIVPDDIPLNILFEDKWILVLNKHAGIICHPAHGTQRGTIANAIAFHAETLSKGSDPFRPGIVHRLDKNTTGVMVIAKTDEAHWRISLQFERRTLSKEYFAICEGHINLDADVIDRPLAPHPDTTQRMILKSASPPRRAMFKSAITRYQVDKRYRGYTTVDLFPKTGRTHQLRVHMQSLNHPMVGDETYGGRAVSELDLAGEGSPEPIMSSQALHARRLTFVHPILEKTVTFEAPLPLRMTQVLELLEAHRRR